jgi:hypothetical protein
MVKTIKRKTYWACYQLCVYMYIYVFVYLYLHLFITNLCAFDHQISAVHYTTAQMRCHKSSRYVMSGVYSPDTSSPKTWKCSRNEETMKEKNLRQSQAAPHNTVWKMDRLWQILPCCKVMGSYWQSEQSSGCAAPHRQVTMWPAHVHCTQHDATGMNHPQTLYKLSSWQHVPLPPFSILE